MICVRLLGIGAATTMMMAERGVAVDHATAHRCAPKILPVPAKVFRTRKHPVGRS